MKFQTTFRPPLFKQGGLDRLENGYGMEAEVCRIGNHQMCLKTNYRVLLFYEIFFKNIYYFNLNGKIMIFNYSKIQKSNE